MRLEFFFDFSCPYAYIASTQIESVAARVGLSVTYKPMLLGGVFRDIGLVDSPMASMCEAKAKHNLLDMHRWADHYETPLSMPGAHPMRTVRALRALLSLPEPAWPRVIHALYQAYWQRGDELDSAETIERVFTEAGFAAEQRARAVFANDDPDIKQALRMRTTEAVERGVFGAPTVFVDNGQTTDMFWGQDRLDFVEKALGVANAQPPTTEGFSSAKVDFWYDFSSPFAYLAATQIERICEEADAQLTWRPMLLGGLFKEIGTPNVPLQAMAPAKERYMRLELERWAARWRVPFIFASRFPMKTVTALRLALVAGPRVAELNRLLFRALWVDDQDISDPKVLRSLLDGANFDGQDMLERTRDPQIKQTLIDQTTAAQAAGVFGAPTTIVTLKDQAPMLLWGQDRLQLVARTLRGWRPACG